MEQKGYIVVITSTTYEFCLQINIYFYYYLQFEYSFGIEVQTPRYGPAGITVPKPNY